MKRTRFNAWLGYALAGMAITGVVAGVVGALIDPAAVRAVWVAAVIAYGLQLVAFALLLALREQAQLFLMAWLGGMVLRFAVLGACAYWLSRTAVLPRATMLVSFVGFLFLLLLLEPVFLRWDLRRS